MSLRSIDIPGAILCAAATICLLLGLTWGGEQTSAWTSPQVMGMLASGILLLVLFLFVERKASEPILPLDLFRNAVFSVGASLSLLQMMVIMGLTLYLPRSTSRVSWPFRPTNAGLVMTPFSVSMVIGAMLSSQVLGRFRHYRLVAVVSALIMCIGAFLVTRMTPVTGIARSIGILVLTGIGIGPFFSLPMVAVQNALPADRLGTSTAALRYLGQLGASLGIAIVGTVVASSVSGNLLGHFPTTTASKLGLSVALQHGFSAILIFALITFVVALFLKEKLIIATEGNLESESVVEVQASEESDKELVHA